ncbi:MAG: rhodanese-like domain-containing protein [Deltaproteobacteria bacterium]|nr:rhodanese-like domain-containing protein [Deltaproteobacteria bacterium]
MIVLYVALLILTTAVLLGAAWWRRRRASAPREVDWPEVMAEAERGRYRLISTEEMANRYRRDSQSLLLVDTRPEGEYRAGHIRGAVNLSLTPTWRGRWRSRKLLAALLGPDKERLVVFY